VDPFLVKGFSCSER